MKHRKEKTKRILALLLCAVLLAGLLPAGALAEGEACAHENTYTAAENAVYASCTQDGSHEEVTYCAVCGVELNRTTVTDYAVGHILGQAVTENEVPATCTQDGSYEEVTYCTICGTELSRVPVTDYAVGHMAGETVTENEVPATCMQDGSHEQVTYCTVCGAELSRVLVTDYAVGHIPGQAVTENEVPATCTQDGNHEEVTCCTVCGAELSRVPVTDPKLEMTVTAELEENELQQDELQQDELQKSPAAAQDTEEQQKKAAEPQEPDALEATTEEEAESAAKRLGGTRGGTDLVYTVTLSPGAIGGIPIVYRSDEGTIAELPDFWQFYYEPDGTMGFTLDFRQEYCPFTPPDEIHFAGWKDVQTGKEAFEFNRLSALETTFTALWTGTLADLGPIEGIPPVTGETICMNGKAWQVIGRSPEYRLLISSGVLGRDDWWKGAVTYCDGVVFPSFTSAEKEAMLAVTKYEDTDYGIYGKESLNGEKMFLLSAAETDWYFPTDAARDIDHPWWTRSGDGNKAGCVDADGQLGNIDCDENAGLRPAFVLQNSSFLFTSDNVSAKSTPYAGGGSFGILNAGSNVVKPTLLDSSRFGFTANAGEGDVAAVAPGGSLSILYSGAVDYVSAMLTVSNKTYYASIVPDSAAGVWTMTLPGDLVPGRSYVLKVFSEQQNIADYADYASPMREITLNVITSDLLYALPVGESVPLSEIMTALNLYGEVAAVEVSNENLFSASVENGNWIVTSRQSFDAPQWMKVTINGITYEITVTNAGGITTWTALQNELNQGGTVTLTGNLTAGTDDGALTVPEGANVTLDLAGFTLDRGLWFSIARENGSVIINHGTMTITDSSSRKTGRITGGNTLGNGGGISNDGTLTLAGGSIRGNVSSENAGGVWNGGTMNMSGGKIENNTAGENAGGVWNGGTMNMTGGEITSNTADVGNGGGVWNGGTMNMSGGSITFNISEGSGGLYISGTSIMNVSGSPVVTDNVRVKTGGSESSNLFLDGNALIGVTGKLSSANICISRSAGFGVFTSGYGANNAPDDPAEYFHPNSSDYVIKLENNEAKIDQKEDDGVHYIMRSWDGTKVVSTPQAAEQYTLMSAVQDSNSTRLQDGVYVIQGNVSFSKRLRLAEGAVVTLVLCDGAKLTMEKGIGVIDESKLIICGQENDSGILDAKSGSDDAPIGADNKKTGGWIEIQGGHVIATAKGESTSAAIGGAKESSPYPGVIRIYGGQVDATAEGYGAGIGGGQDTTSPRITIYDGTVNASAVSGAGIGTGDSVLTTNLDYNGDEIQIFGGVITADGGGAGIGGGTNNQNPNIRIRGGVIRATSESNGGESGAGIGSGRYSEQSGVITIENCDVYAMSLGGAGIGAGARGDAGSITIENSFVSAVSTNGGAGIGGGRRGGDGGTVTISDSTVIAVGLESNDQNQALDKYNQMAKNFAAHRHNKVALSVASMFNLIGAIAFATSDDESGAGIGGGYNGVGGSVSISNSYVVASASVGKARAIGHGTGKSNPGTLSLDSLAAVYTGKDDDHTAPAAYDERELACQSNRYALILPCQHEGCSYIVTETTHTIVCSICNGTFAPELHVWENIPNGKRCSVCQYSDETCTVHFERTGDVYGTMADARVVKDKDYRLPECGYIPRENNVTFVEWEVKIGDAGSVTKNPGEFITVTADTTVTPVWGELYTVTFDLDGGTIEGSPSLPAQSLLYGEKITRPADPVKEGCTFQDWYQVMDEQGNLADHPYYFSSRVDRDLTLKAVWTPINYITTFEGATGSFNDRIKLNFYFNFPDDLLEDEYAYVTLTKGERGTPEKHLIRFTDYIIGKGYKFSMLLAAKEVSDMITARVYDSKDKEYPIRRADSHDNSTETCIQGTLMHYLDWLAEHGTDDKEKAVGAAAKDYCSAAQKYFNYYAESVSVSSAVNAVTNQALEGYISSREGTMPEGVSIRGISAMLEADNTLRLYFSFDGVNPDGLTFEIDGYSAELKQRADGARYLAMNYGVWPNKLQGPHTYTVSNGTSTYTITASVLTYARACALRTNENESNLGKALYLYNQAAVAAFGG